MRPLQESFKHIGIRKQIGRLFINLELFIILSLFLIFFVRIFSGLFGDYGFSIIFTILGGIFVLVVMINSCKAADPGTLANTYEIVSVTPNSVTYLDEDNHLHEKNLTGNATKVFQDSRNVVEIYEGSFMGIVTERYDVHINNNIAETSNSD